MNLDQRNRIKKFVFRLFGAVIISVIAFSAYWYVENHSKPLLGPSLELPTPTYQVAQGTDTPQAQAETPTTPDLNQTEVSPILPSPTPTALEELAAASPSPTPEPVCNGPEKLRLLAVAADTYDEDYLYGLADAIRLIQIDFVEPSVRVIAIPRDLWVEIPEISHNYGITHGKINQAYLYGNKGFGYYDGPGEGPGLMARTVVANFGIYVDHYGGANMRTFVDIVDTLGGVDLYLEEAVDGNFDPYGDYFGEFGYFPAGWNHMNGQQALDFSRIRSIDSTFGRDNRQSLVAVALWEKALSLRGVLNVNGIIEAFIGRIQTDLTFDQLVMLSCLGFQLKRENIVFAQVPWELLHETWKYSEQLGGDTFVFEMKDPEVVREYIVNFLENSNQ